jgi:hypothetical protein
MFAANKHKHFKKTKFFYGFNYKSVSVKSKLKQLLL